MDAVMALCHFCEHHGPSIVFCSERAPELQVSKALDGEHQGEEIKQENGIGDSSTAMDNGSKETKTTTPNQAKEKNPKKTDFCQACRSLPEDNPGFITYDHDVGTKYISTQHPHNPDIYSLVRQACVRSLSCEVCPGREGPILFGDEKSGYVISYTFYLKDHSARGQQSWYSIICMMTDRVFLVQSWPFLVGCIGKVIDYLQKCAQTVCASESANIQQCSSRFNIRMVNAVTPRNFRQQRGDASNAKSLVQLTGNPELYSYLHTSFTWIMLHSRKRIREHVVDVPPVDDDIVKAEILARNSRSNSVISNEDVALLESASDLSALLLNDSEEGEQNRNCFTSLRQMRNVLMPPLFKAIAWHLLIGNQVVWRGQDQQMVSSALLVLKDILPVGCVKMVTSSDTYLPSYKANLLGLKENVAIPAHARNSEFFIFVDVVPKVTTSQRLSQLYTALPMYTSNVLNGIEFRMTSGCVIPEKMPNMLHKLEVALANDSLSSEVVEHCLICLKQEWMNKAKVLYKFVKVDNRNAEDTNKLLQSCLNCTEEDIQLLKFWMKGLSKQFKEKQIQAARAEKT